ncbi:MAG: TIGR01777 family oxidoreductase [Bdellovibrio sp.]
MRILMTGATGLIGKEIGKSLAEKGHELFVISRSLAKAREQLPFPCEVIVGDISKGKLDDPRLSQIEAVINLIGEPIFGSRWNDKKKKNIYSSRIDGTRNLIASLPKTVQAFISSSAIGYYGDCGEEFLDENHDPGKDFLAQVCVDWEAAAAEAPGRKVFIRTGVVLSSIGGALEQMYFPFRAGVGGVLGNGHQWMSWIHIKDIVGLYVFALENSSLNGALNAVAPQPVTNKEFSEKLAQALDRHLALPVPMLALKVVFGEAAEVLFSSIKATAVKAERNGYSFQYSDIANALEEVCAPFKNGNEIYYSEQYLPEPPEKVFDFFKDAYNLEKLTPPTLRFKIEKMSSSQVRQGTEIDYTISIHGVPMKWETEIKEWEPPYRFADDQKKGPYHKWYHTHEFKPFCGGTLLVDKVQYQLPFGYLGWLAGIHFIQKDIEHIFSFRRNYISTMDVSRKD